MELRQRKKPEFIDDAHPDAWHRQERSPRRALISAPLACSRCIALPLQNPIISGPEFTNSAAPPRSEFCLLPSVVDPVSTEAQPTPIKTNSPRAHWWILLVVLAMVATQYFSTRVNSTRQRPGIERGDVVLQQNDLPIEIHGWRQTAFEPAKPAEDLPKGQFWWTHVWNYTNGTQNCVVTFDQADFTTWHELTICYRATGWELTKREVVSRESTAIGRWDIVIAHFKRGSLEKAVLMFSLFNADGRPVQSPDFGDISTMTDDVNLWERFQHRIAADPESYERVLQCQVFVPLQQNLSGESIENLLLMHNDTRERFRDVWTKHHPGN